MCKLLNKFLKNIKIVKERNRLYMQSEELVKIVNEVIQQRYESQIIELKSAENGWQTKIYDTISSFSNQDSGGIIIFGIDEKSGYNVNGVYDAQDLQKKDYRAMQSNGTNC